MKLILQLIIILAALFSFIGFVTFIGFNHLNSIGVSVVEITDEELPSLTALREMKISTLSFESTTREIVLHRLNDAEGGELYNNTRKALEASLDAYRSHLLENDKDETDYFDELENKTGEFTKKSDEYIDYYRRGLDLTAKEEELDEASDSLVELLDIGIRMELNEISNSKELVKSNVKNFSDLAITAIIVSIITAAGITFYFFNLVLEPVDDLRIIAEKISRGQLDQKIDLKRKDEIGDLANSLDNMRYSLKTVIDEYEKEKGGPYVSPENQDPPKEEQTKPSDTPITKKSKKA
jgi:methyl-accepting chemotaxis protein